MTDEEKDEDEFPRKLVFKKDKDAGKLRLAFRDGTIEVKLGKQGGAYRMSRKEVRKLALWLKWYAKLEMSEAEPEADGDAKAEISK